MDIIKSYKKNVIENKNFVFVTAVVAFLIRLGFYSVYDQPEVDTSVSGYLWTPALNLYLKNNFLSFSLSLVFTLGIILYSSFLNSKHKLIRNRTYLIYIFTILLFSCHPMFVYMNPQYVALLLFLGCLDSLLSSYQQAKAASNAYTVGFLLGLSTLFSFHAIMYIPLFWIGFRYMRCLQIKTFLASLFGLMTVYWIVFFYFLWQNELDVFYEPFKGLYPSFNPDVHLVSLDKIVVLVVSAVLLVTMILSYMSTSFHDKIQTRANLSFLFISSVFSFLAFVFINCDQILNLCVFISSGCFLLAHFFTLTDHKWKVHLFYIFITLYFIVCIYFLSNKVITAILAV